MEINKKRNETETTEPRDSSRKQSVVKTKESDARNYDEIITVKRHEPEESSVIVKPKDDLKEKGFSIQRAWCCLRRTS